MENLRKFLSSFKMFLKICEKILQKIYEQSKEILLIYWANYRNQIPILLKITVN